METEWAIRVAPCVKENAERKSPLKKKETMERSTGIV